VVDGDADDEIVIKMPAVENDEESSAEEESSDDEEGASEGDEPCEDDTEEQ